VADEHILRSRTAAGSEELALIVRWQHRNGRPGRYLARVHVPAPPARPLALLTEYAENPTGVGITTDADGAAQALIEVLPAGLAEPGDLLWVLHHGAFSYYDAYGEPDTFTVVDLRWDGGHYRGDLSDQRLLKGDQFNFMRGDMPLEPVADVLARLGER
jgi:hypothetical protein